MRKKVDIKKYNNSFKWNFEAYPFFCSAYQKASAPVSDRYYVDWSIFLSYFQGDHLYAFLPRKDIIRSGNRIIKELLAGDDNFLKIFKNVHKEIQSTIDICLGVRQNNNYNNFGKWWPPVQNALSRASQVLFGFDYALDGYLKNLQKKAPSEFKIFSECMQAGKPSFIDEANARLIQLDKKYKNNFGETYRIFISEFGWFQNSYQGVFKINKSWLKKYLKEIKKEKSAPILKTKSPKKFKLLVEAANLGITFRDDKKKLLLIAVELMDEWLKNICRENNWQFEELRWLSLDEVLMILKGEKKYLRMARRFSSQGLRLGLLTQLGYDEITKSFWDKVYNLNSAVRDIEKIDGVAANKGFYRGVAKIITNAKEGGKIKKGEILVASMTRPEYLLLIKKAGAIITDEGGITCHAAIISRELKIPCIIGTKIATQVLKDGDLVEVDAEKGVVKILK